MTISLGYFVKKLYTSSQLYGVMDGTKALHKIKEQFDDLKERRKIQNRTNNKIETTKFFIETQL